MADSEALERTEQRECVRAIGIRLIHVTLDVRWRRCVLFIAGLVLRSVEITR